MDLKQFISTYRDNGLLPIIADGFEKSAFVEPNAETSSLIKSILSALISDDGDKQHIYSQLQSGGLAGTKTCSKNESAKKQSYCTEFNQMVANILGLLGSEFSKYLFVLFGAKIMINHEVNAIEVATDYRDILFHVTNIRNLIHLGDSVATINHDSYESPIDIDVNDEFMMHFNLDDTYSSSHHYHDIEIMDSTTTKTHILDHLIMEIDENVRADNVITFETDRAKYHEALRMILDHIILRTYFIRNVDDLIINLGSFELAYDKSFIKMFEILYKESFADIPYEMRSQFKPHIACVENELKLELKCSKYIGNFNRYFHKIYDETLKSVREVLDDDNILNVEVTDEMYELLSDITFNLFLNISKKIAGSQLTQAYFGKSTRIQFIQMFQALMDCSPRLYGFTKSQRMMIHYILLSKKVLCESIVNCNKLDGEA